MWHCWLEFMQSCAVQVLWGLLLLLPLTRWPQVHFSYVPYHPKTRHIILLFVPMQWPHCSHPTRPCEQKAGN